MDGEGRFSLALALFLTFLLKEEVGMRMGFDKGMRRRSIPP